MLCAQILPPVGGVEAAEFEISMKKKQWLSPSIVNSNIWKKYLRKIFIIQSERVWKE